MNTYAKIVLSSLVFTTWACTAKGQASSPPPTAAGELNPDAIVDYHESLEPDGRTLIYRSVKVQSLDEPGKQVVIGQVLERTDDGNFRLVPGRQPAEADLYRQKLCQKLGGVDISNDNGGLIIGPGTVDGAACKGPSPNSKASKYLPKAFLIENGVVKDASNPLEIDGEPSGWITPAASDYVTPSAPSRAVVANQNFTVGGRVLYGSTSAGMATGRLTVMNRCIGIGIPAYRPSPPTVWSRASPRPSSRAARLGFRRAVAGPRRFPRTAQNGVSAAPGHRRCRPFPDPAPA